MWIKGLGERPKGDVCSLQLKTQKPHSLPNFRQEITDAGHVGEGGVWEKRSPRRCGRGPGGLRVGLDLIKAMAVSIDLILAQGLNTQRQEGESLSPWPLLSVACGQWVN